MPVESSVEQTVPSEVENYITLDNIPLFFISSQDQVADIISHHGFSHFYVLGNEIGLDENKKEVSYGVLLFLVVNNTLGVSIQPVYNDSFPKVSAMMHMSLPKIPRKMIASMDKFFREVDKRNHSEAIVVLTYDIAMSPDPEGWGYIVPVQKNNAAHCSYEPESLHALFPNDTTIQVGTAHSHPDMPAYKSDTDNKDQLAAGDGVHMTFGWQKHVDHGATKFYCEIQMGAVQRQVSPEYLFEDYEFEVDEERILSDIEKVSKDTSWATSYGVQSGTGSSSKPSTYHGGPSSFGNSEPQNKLINLPKDAPDPKQSTIIMPIIEKNNKYLCSGCDSPLIDLEVDSRRCFICKMPLRLGEETIGDILEARKSNHQSYAEIDIDGATKPPFPIYLWDWEETATGYMESIACIWAPEGHDSGK